MIRAKQSNCAYRVFALLDYQHRNLCAWVKLRQSTAYKHSIFLEAFPTNDARWDAVLDVPGVTFFRIAARAGEGNRLLNTNHAHFKSQIGEAFDWSRVVSALHLVQ